jgi:hypothetical protein
MQTNENSTPAELLDSCLSRLQDGEEITEATLRAFPQHAQDIAPLVEIARQIRLVFPVPAPNENFRRNSKIRLLNRLRATQPPTRADKPREAKKERLAWLPARAFVTIFIAFLLVISTTGVAWASSDALPGDALYSVKRGVEELRLGITFSESGDAELLNDFTSERMDEIEALILAGRDEDLTEALQNYEDMLNRLVNQVMENSQSEDQESLDQFESNLSHQMEVLERVQANVPEHVQAKMEEVKEQTQHGKAVVECIQQGGDPSDLAPGQLKKQTPQSDSGVEDHGSGKTKTPKPKEKKTPGPPPWANPGGQDNPNKE